MGCRLFRELVQDSCRNKVRAAGIVILSLVAYVGVATYQLTLPGLEYDEVFFGPAALGCTQDFSAPSSSEPAARVSPLAFTTFSVSIGSHSLPVMLMPYWGAVKVHLQTPIFFLGGASPWTIRLPAVALGVLTLWLFFLLCARFFSLPVGLLALLLLASDPSYVFYTRHDFGGATLSLLLIIGPLWCLMRWSETSNTRVWTTAFFLFGLGLYHRLDYLGFLTAVGVTALACSWGFLRNRLGKREVILAGGCLVLGCAPYLLFVWQRPALASSVLSVVAPAQDLPAAAQVKGYVLWTVLNGRSLYDFFSGRSGINVGKVRTAEGEVQVGSYAADTQSLHWSSLFLGTFTPYCFLFFFSALWSLRPPPRLKALGIFLAVLLGYLFAVQGVLRGHHFVIVLPFMQAFLAASLLFLRERMKGQWASIVLVTVGVTCIGTNLTVDVCYHRLLTATGGRGIWSDAIYDLTHYLQERCPPWRCFIGDWGMGTQVVTLAEGDLAVEEIFWPYLHSGDKKNGLDSLVRTEKALFIFYADSYVNFSRPKRLVYGAAKRAGLEIVIERVFVERDGVSVIEVVQMKKERGHEQRELSLVLGASRSDSSSCKDSGGWECR